MSEKPPPYDAEATSLVRHPGPPPLPMQQVVRFGEKAIEMKLLAIDQVEEALAAQEDGRRRGLDRSVGAWLHDRGLLDLVQVQRVMAELGAPERGRLLPDVELQSLLGRGKTSR